MLKKYLNCFLALPLLFFGSLERAGCKQDASCDASIIEYEECDAVDGYVNLRFGHERENEKAFGPNNRSAVAFNPLLTIGDVTIDADFYYGYQFTHTKFFGSKRHAVRFLGADRINKFYGNLTEKDKKTLKDAMKDNILGPRFYRLHSRAIYENKKCNFRVVLGDTVSRNQLGFQQPLSGFGISVFRKAGDGSTITGSSPIVITRVSKVECSLGTTVLCARILAPGVYTLSDLPEEARLPGVSVKISDQLSRNEKLDVDYFGEYKMLKAGENDFDVSVLLSNKCEFLDPHKIKYKERPHFSANYRYATSDKITLGAGTQYYDDELLLDYVMIFATPIGKISPNIAYSYKKVNDKESKDAFKDKTSKSTVGIGVFYSIPENEYGVSFEVFAAHKGKGFVDLGKRRDEKYMYYKTIDDLGITTSQDEEVRRNDSLSSFDSVNEVTARLYSKPVFGVTPAIIFNGLWSASRRLREYTLSFSKKIFNKITLSVSAGVSYDYPSKGYNQGYPDRRLTVAFSIPIGNDVEILGDFGHHDDDREKTHGKIQYKPKTIPGLEINVEASGKPGSHAFTTSAKYENDYGDIKFEDVIGREYGKTPDKDKYSNNQKFLIGTSVSPSGIRAHRKSGINVLRTAKKKPTKKK